MTMSHQIETIIKKVEILKKKQMIILELKSIISAMKKSQRLNNILGWQRKNQQT